MHFTDSYSHESYDLFDRAGCAALVFALGPPAAIAETAAACLLLLQALSSDVLVRFWNFMVAVLTLLLLLLVVVLPILVCATQQ